jgi:hypothetical protein
MQMNEPTIDPRISQHLVPLVAAAAADTNTANTAADTGTGYLRVLDPQDEQALVAGIREEQARPMFREHGLRGGVLLLAATGSFQRTKTR